MRPFTFYLSEELMEEVRQSQLRERRDMKALRDYFDSSPPPKLFGGLQSRNNETGESNEQNNQQGV